MKIPFIALMLVCFPLVQLLAQTKQDPLKDSVDVYTKKGKHDVALGFARQWVELVKKQSGTESLAYADALASMGSSLRRTGKAEEAISAFEKVLDIRLRLLGEFHNEVARAYANLGRMHHEMANYFKAEPYQKKVLEIRLKLNGEFHVETAKAYNNYGNLQQALGNYTLAETCLLKNLEINKAVLDIHHPDLLTSYYNLGNLYHRLNHFEKAETYHRIALNMTLKELGPGHPYLADSYNGLGNIHVELGNHALAEQYFQKSLEIRVLTGGPEDPSVAESHMNRGLNYLEQADFRKAEVSIQKAFDLYTKALGPEHPETALAELHFGTLQSELGNLENAISHTRHSIEVFRKTYGENHTFLASAYSNLAGSLKRIGDFQNAESNYLNSIEIQKKATGENSSDLAKVFTSLGFLYISWGKYAKAKTYFERSLEILKTTFGESHFGVAISYSNLGQMYVAMGKYAEAEACFRKALTIRKAVLNTGHPGLADTYFDLGKLFAETENQPESENYFSLNWENNLRQFQRYLPFMAENQKVRFLEKKTVQLEMQKACYFNNLASRPSLTRQLYDQQLNTKGLLLSSSLKFRHRLRRLADTVLKKKYLIWDSLTNQISKLYSSTDSTSLARLKVLQEKAEALEKELLSKSADFNDLVEKKVYKWTSVQKGLKPGEAAIEMVRFQAYGYTEPITDTSDPQKPTYLPKGLTHKVRYAALIVKPGLTWPEVVFLEDEPELEGRKFLYYKNCISKGLPDNQSYKVYWEKISAKLGQGLKRVYFSPDGIFHSINLSTLKNPKTGKYLMDEKEIRVVTNTKDLIVASETGSNPAFACLIGYPDYNTGKERRSEIFRQQRSNPEITYNLGLSRSDALAELPATRVEVNNISSILQKKGWKVETLMGENALEESIKAMQKPRILHIATHGFFHPDSTRGENPLVHSGLLLTGANKTLAGEKDDKVEDGILTAYEAMNLNLDNTDLVVLSACETGLGEIKNGEGVYGLQRAFKVAGAKTIIMSLWKVSDQATQELMVSFYKHWLGEAVGSALGGKTASGKTASGSSQARGEANRKRAAFIKAQKELKAKYPDPFYWGAFVMVGE